MTGMLLGPDAVVVGLCLLVGGQLASSTLDTPKASELRNAFHVPWWMCVLLAAVLNAGSLLAEHVWARTVEHRWNARCKASRARHTTTDRVGFHLVQDLAEETRREVATFVSEHMSLGVELSVLQHVSSLHAIVLARQGDVISGFVGVHRHAWELKSDVDRCEDTGGTDSLLSNWQRCNAAHASATDATWNVRTLVVASKLRRKGLGRHVMQCLLEAARAHGVSFVELHVDVDAASAQHSWLCRFYESLGFCAVSRRSKDVHMVCLLTPTP